MKSKDQSLLADKNYQKPDIEVIEIAVEKGYVGSGFGNEPIIPGPGFDFLPWN